MKFDKSLLGDFLLSFRSYLDLVIFILSRYAIPMGCLFQVARREKTMFFFSTSQTTGRKRKKKEDRRFFPHIPQFFFAHTLYIYFSVEILCLRVCVFNILYSLFSLIVLVFLSIRWNAKKENCWYSAHISPPTYLTYLTE